MEFINFILILFLNIIAFVSSGTAGGGSQVITIAGNFFGRSVNGVSTYATFMQPSGLAVDNLDNVYIADATSNQIRYYIASTQTVVLVAGSVNFLFGSNNGIGTYARFNNPWGIGFANNVLYIADSYSNRIRAMTTSGEVSTLAGGGSLGTDAGLGTYAQLSIPTDRQCRLCEYICGKSHRNPWNDQWAIDFR